MDKSVAMICNKAYVEISDDYIPTHNRNAMVHGMIEACGLTRKLDIIKPNHANLEQLMWFHSQDYLDFIKMEECDSNSEEDEEFGFGYDCPLKRGLFDYCLEIAGGSITAARLLCSKSYRIVLHWLGGWHHAKRSEAAGYCYVNDCVLAILQLRKTYSKVLYVDLDLHHGDGVQEAFYGTDKVMTFSVHKFEPGFFPGSGAISETGFGKGKNFSVNLPLYDGVGDETFIAVCQKVLGKVKEKFSPDAVVCQVGADGLNGDPMRSFNLTADALEQCVNTVVAWNLPTLILGGGGYCEANVARCWTRITASILKVPLPDEIPEHSYFIRYAPGFDFDIEKSLKKDMNSKEHLEDVVSTIYSNLDKL